MRLVLHDYSGHPFPPELSRELARRGHQVRHVHCTSYATGKGSLTVGPDDPPGLQMVPIDLGEPFDKYRYHRRVLQELKYGRLFNAAIDPASADVLVCGNVPLLSLGVIARQARRAGLPFVFWQQDVYSLAMADAARQAVPGLGRLLGAAFVRLERHIATTSTEVVTISPDFLPILTTWGVAPDRQHVVENWAPLSDIPLAPEGGRAWRTAHGLGDGPVVLYAGTLGMKHDPGQLLAVARALAADPAALLVVVSEGQGADTLQAQAAAEGLTNLRVLPFQPIEDFPSVLAAADVLVAVLEPEAGVFSVPSKILSYHCAGRPMVAAVPAGNLAARTIEQAGSGIVVAPGDDDGLVAAVEKLLGDPDGRTEMGAAARAYAEATFDIHRIGDRFEAVVDAASTRSRP
jgi:glycosyltransferase involved in cell wall biosynthesis